MRKTLLPLTLNRQACMVRTRQCLQIDFESSEGGMRINENSISLPAGYHTEELSQILELSAMFDGYAEYGDDLATLANEAMGEWTKSKTLPHDLTLIKACLFFEGRRGRFVYGYPDESDMPYLRALRDVVIRNLNVHDQ